MVVLALAAIATVTALVIAAWRFGGPSGQDVHGLSSAGGNTPVTHAAATSVVAVRALRGASFVVVRYRRSTGRPLFSGTLERGDVQTLPAAAALGLDHVTQERGRDRLREAHLDPQERRLPADRAPPLATCC